MTPSCPRLLEQPLEVAEAAHRLGRKFALSRRQAYRYLEEAARLRGLYILCKLKES